MAKMLQLGPKIRFPLTAITETYGILAARGAGKSNAAAVMAEAMYEADLPFVVIDPVGAWWGLRSSADGKAGGGLSIPIFGGEHGDVPLERGSGILIADLIVTERLSCVLDLTGFDSEHDKKQFLLPFAQRLYQKNRDPLHLFLEEADDYIPQKPMRDEAYLLRAWENMVRRGRARGLGVTLITQRSASINKSVLTQVQTLIALRTTGPQDIAAIEQWVKYHGQSREILSSLAGLKDGEAWIYSPNFLRRTFRADFYRRETYDSGATPKSGAAPRKPAKLADVDLGAIRTQMAETIERVKTNDPKLLHKRIYELEKFIASESKTPAVKTKVEIKEVALIKEPTMKRLEKVANKLELVQGSLGPLIDEVNALRKDAVFTTSAKAEQAANKILNDRSIQFREVRSKHDMPEVMRRAVIADNGRLPEGEKTILTALAQLETASKQQLTVITGYKRSTRDAYLARLNSKGYIRMLGQQVSPDVAGIEALHREGGFEPLPTGAALQEHWIKELPEGESKILTLLIDNKSMNSEALSERTGYKRSTRDAYLSRLKARQLITGDGRSGYEISDHLRGS